MHLLQKFTCNSIPNLSQSSASTTNHMKVLSSKNQGSAIPFGPTMCDGSPIKRSQHVDPQSLHCSVVCMLQRDAVVGRLYSVLLCSAGVSLEHTVQPSAVALCIEPSTIFRSWNFVQGFQNSLNLVPVSPLSHQRISPRRTSSPVPPPPTSMKTNPGRVKRLRELHHLQARTSSSPLHTA